jgi:hypothetical protein
LNYNNLKHACNELIILHHIFNYQLDRSCEKRVIT